MSLADPESNATPDKSPKARRRNGANARDEAQMALVKPVANWQAKLAWACASWGLIPVAGVALGLLALFFGLLGWRRAHRRPEDLGVRHAVGAVVLGTAEVIVNSVGIGFIIKGLMELNT